ncbi:putative single stranded DNA-binding protein [Alcanivorax jadensis T9]|uniref:Single stranded DNA-binding protein n=1 Tax=Alcanivorax jadensis T9 TaxID=1177181 RepID=A0ABR4WHC0_9GAMM|nr:DNA-binding protein [Alcanivorax jadensis]KGD62910.1 putative single stranded DNA-binding protein [Alcanivorax jadensis T9]
MALLLKGNVLGYKKVARTNNKTGEVIEQHYVGIQVPKENGYDGEAITYDIRISKQLFSEGLAAHYEKFKGQEVYVPVFPSVWKGEKSAGINWFFSGDGKPKGVKA